MGYDPQHQDERAAARKPLALLTLEDTLDARAWREAFNTHLAPLGGLVTILSPGIKKWINTIEE
ncbi:MAG: hypothetical protein QG608_2948 [Actinomycetota bacterium]|nr:hypothetical protein [Actinomycetota bacterium]